MIKNFLGLEVNSFNDKTNRPYKNACLECGVHVSNANKKGLCIKCNMKKVGRVNKK